MLKLRIALLWLAIAAASLFSAHASAGEPVAVAAGRTASFKATEARQGVAVDDRFYYAIDNRMVAKYDKKTGERVADWQERSGGPIVHLNSGVVVDGKLYAAHSNYPAWPAASSVEIWKTRTLEHVGTYSLGAGRGALTWLDFHEGAWWGAFAHYNHPFGGSNRDTRIVRFDAEWRITEAWVLPEALLKKFGDMSNSGGSWGPDGRLWITGHDRPEAYALTLPEAGSMLRWTGTLTLDITGQGIAWDRSNRKVIWGVVRDAKGGSRVTESRMELP